MRLTYFPLPRGPLADGTGRVGGWNITSYFGPRIDPIRGGAGNHGGQDIAGAGIDSQPFYAVTDGYVSQGWDPGGGGNWTTLHGPNGSRFGYGHAKAFAPGVNGRTVPAGTLLGWIGTTGASTGSHLHFAYDSEDANTSYDDPFDILADAAAGGRYVGSTPGLLVPITPPEGLTMAQLDDINGKLDKILTAVSPFGYLGELHGEEAGWEQDTRVVILNGVKVLVNDALYPINDRLTQVGWSSRDYPICYEGDPDIYMWVDTDTGRRRQWIPDQPAFQELVQSKLNPYVVVFPKARRAAHDEMFPTVGKTYQPAAA